MDKTKSNASFQIQSRQKLLRTYIHLLYRPLLEYFDSVWDNSSSEMIKKLDAIHIETARTITVARNLYSIDKLLADIG